MLKRHGVDWNVLTTIHAVNGDHGGEVYRFLRDDLGASFIQFIPIIERATPETLPIADAGWGSGVHGRPLYVQDGIAGHPPLGRRREQYGRFMIDVFEEWVRHDIGTVYVQMFDTALANWYGEPGGMCVHAETCGLQLALEHNGDLYSCDHFVEPGYLLGNIGDRHMLELIASPQQRKFGNDKRDTLTQFCLRLRRAVRLQRRLPQGPVRHRTQTASPASTTCARATRSSSTTSGARWRPWPSCSGRTGHRPS